MIYFKQITITAITQEGLRDSLRDRATEMGSQKALAEHLGVSAQYLGDVLSGKREPGDSILKALGLRKTVHYEMR